MDNNPFAPPQAPLSVDPERDRQYGNFRRGHFFLATFVIGLFQGLATSVAPDSGCLIIMLFLLPTIAAHFYRMKNIGYNPWYSLLVVVPLANIIISVRCTVMQEGYVETRKLDTTGVIISWLLFLLIAALLGVILLAFYVSSNA
jgi:uncharacterized membrane protein YhaH (DUF805 family)